MVMLSLSKKEHLLHPQAKLIPDRLWNNVFFFNQKLDTRLLPFMQGSNEELLRNFDSLNIVRNLDDQEKFCAWLAIVLSHKKLSYQHIKQLTAYLPVHEYAEIKLACAWGDMGYLQYLIHHFALSALNALPKAISEKIDKPVLLRYPPPVGYFQKLKNLIKQLPEASFSWVIEQVYCSALSYGHISQLLDLFDLAPE